MLEHDMQRLKSAVTPDFGDSFQTETTVLSDDLSEPFALNEMHSKSSRSGDRRVRFSNVEIQEYNLTVGDVDCDAYPLALDWAHTKPTQIPVDEYKTRPCNPLSSQSRRQRIAKVSGHSVLYVAKLETIRLTKAAKSELFEWSRKFDERVKQPIKSKKVVAADPRPTRNKGLMDLTQHLDHSQRSFDYKHGEDNDSNSLPASDDDFF